MSANPAISSFHQNFRLLFPYLSGFFVFVLFKLLVPEPWFTKDSWDYINIAWRNDLISYRPPGYTEYLRVIHDFGGNYNTAIYVQYLFFLTSSALFLERAFFLFDLKLPAKIIAWCVTIYNPFVFYLSNFLITDILFTSFTCLWLLSLINYFLFSGRKSYLSLAIHLVTYFFLFRLRYNALYYPVFAILAALVYQSPVLKKIVVVVLTLVLVGGIVNQVEDYTEKTTSTRVFSALGGWAIANNALHIYQIEDVNQDWSDEYLNIHRAVLDTRKNVSITKEVGITDQYMWHMEGPLKTYLFFKLNFTKRRYMEEYFALAPLYKEFGLDLIKAYPIAFFKSFYIINLRNCMFPRLEILNFKVQDIQQLDDKARNYVRYKGPISKYTSRQIYMVEGMKYAYSVINPLVTLAAVPSIFLYFKKRKTATFALSTLFLMSCFHLLTVLLLAFAHPVWIRYLAFSEILLILIPLTLICQFLNSFSGRASDGFRTVTANI